MPPLPPPVPPPLELTITKHYSADILMDDLRIQLQTLSTNLNSDESVSLRDVVEYLQELPKVARSLYAKADHLGEMDPCHASN